jgi:hypothetical protein
MCWELDAEYILDGIYTPFSTPSVARTLGYKYRNRFGDPGAYKLYLVNGSDPVQDQLYQN